MKRTMYMICIIMAVTVIFSACTKESKKEITEETAVQLQGGNSSGNLFEYGYLAQEGEWIYYSNVEDKGAIYRKKIDDSITEKLNDSNSDYINVCDEWLYYRRPDDHGIYKMKTDGTGEEKIFDGIIGDLNYWDDNLYFATDTDIMKMKTDGSEPQLVYAGPAEYVTVVDNWIYFSNIDEEEFGRVKISGKDYEIIFDGDVERPIVYKDWIYFGDDEYQFCRMKTDGSEKQVISDDMPNCTNVCGDYIYYDNGNEICRMKLDGSEPKIFFECKSSLMDFSITENALYYCYRTGEKYNEEFHMQFEFVDTSESFQVQKIDDDSIEKADAELLSYGEYYRIYDISENGEIKYEYIIYNAEGEIAKRGETYTYEPVIEYITDNILEYRQSAGTNVKQIKYYDINEDKFSEVFDNVFDVFDNKLIYMKDVDTLVVRDIFDAEIYYKEHKLDFAPVAVPANAINKAEFVSRDKIKVNYLTGEEYEEATTTLTLD